MQNNLENSTTGSNEIDLKTLVKPYFKRWKWFIIIPLIFGVMAYFFIKTLTPQYLVTSTVLIKDSKSSGGEFAALNDLAGFGKLGSDGVDNEIEVFKSKKLMGSVVRELGLVAKVVQEGSFRDTELYGSASPVVVKVIREIPDTEFFKKPIQLSIKDNNVTLVSEELKKSFTTQFGKTINLPFATIMILKNPEYDIRKTDKKYADQLLLEIGSFEGVVDSYCRLLSADLASKEATAISLVMKYPEKNKAIDIINKIVDVYNRDAVLDKNSEFKRALEFIDGRILEVGNDLGDVESEKEVFKETNNITDLRTEAVLGLNISAQSRTKQIEVLNQLQINNSMLNFVNQKGDYQVLPINVGLNNSTATSAIGAYNELVLQRTKLLENATPQNPLIIDLNKQIQSLKSIIVESLTKSKQGLESTLGNYENEEGLIASRIAKLPEQEKLFRGIERQQSIKEELYIILLKKREETAISLAMTGEKARIIDYAYSSLKPVSPNKPLLMLIALFFGALIPFIFIYVRELFDDKVRTRQQLETLSGGKPLLGEIPSLTRGQDELIKPNDHQPVAESFRILVTNLNFLLPIKNHAKIILVSSTIKGEGKTFVSVNLAITLASAKKKVLIIGSDIRNPQLQRYDPSSKKLNGVTEYLYDSTLTAKEVITNSKFNSYCDIIYSGSIPPNPTELLMNGRFEELIKEVEGMYDYVIVDSAPMMLVTDSFLISDVADLILYVSRSRFTQKSLIEFAKNNIESGKISNVAFVLNDVNKEYLGYGNKYGYGYHAEEENWFQSFWKKLWNR